MQPQDMHPANRERDGKLRNSSESNYVRSGITADKIQPPQRFTALRWLSLILAVLSLLITIVAGIFVGWNLNDVGFFISIPDTLIINIIFYYAVRTLIQRIKQGKASLFVGTMFFSAILLVVLTPKYSGGPGIYVALFGLWIGAIFLNIIMYNIVRIQHK